MSRISRRLVALACLLSSVTASHFAIAQNRAADGAPAQPQTVVAEQPTTAQSPGDHPAAAGVVVSTDAACMLTVNGIAQTQVLLPEAPRPLRLPPGETAIECTSTTAPDAKVRIVRPPAAGEPRPLALQLADLVVKASCADKPSTLADLGHGVLRHCTTGTDWTQTDVGADTGWDDARAWCAQKGTGWDLASADELAELIDRSGGSRITCGGLTCNVSSLFRLSAPGQWSRDVSGAQMRLLVNMIYGQRHQSNVKTVRGYRGLCVRRP